MGKIIWLIVLIIVAVALYNVFTMIGSNTKFESLSGIFQIPSGLYHPGTPARVGISVNANNNLNSQVSTQVYRPATSTRQKITPPAGFTLEELSPYYGQVEVSSVYQGSSYNPSRFSVRTNNYLSAPVNITGWMAKSNRGNFIIPQAVGDFNPLVPNSLEDIVLKSGDYVNFYSNYSPVGISLRLNSCTGFLNNTYKFNPPLMKNCPSMYTRSEIASFSGACQSLIMSLNGCSTPSPDKVNSMAGPNDAECRAVLKRYNYSWCYEYHHRDSNFFSREWAVWIMNQMNFDWTHDKLQLYDRDNLLVDEYIY